ncbi:hypothetical protein HDU92_004902 [Lobulomyces angularis]|nr:hypothetical protein HDU92_004902 [Lobulomyces angularis]
MSEVKKDNQFKKTFTKTETDSEAEPTEHSKTSDENPNSTSNFPSITTADSSIVQTTHRETISRETFTNPNTPILTNTIYVTDDSLSETTSKQKNSEAEVEYFTSVITVDVKKKTVFSSIVTTTNSAFATTTTSRVPFSTNKLSVAEDLTTSKPRSFKTAITAFIIVVTIVCMLGLIYFFRRKTKKNKLNNKEKLNFEVNPHRVGDKDLNLTLFRDRRQSSLLQSIHYPSPESEASFADGPDNNHTNPYFYTTDDPCMFKLHPV